MNDSINRRMRAMTRHGNRLGIRLEPEVWAAIDLISERKGIRWQTWAEQALDANNHLPDAAGTLNATGILRMAAMSDLYESLIRQEGEYSPPDDLHHPYLQQVTPLNHEQLRKELADSEVVYSCDLGGFVLHAVNRNQGSPSLIIENNMIDKLSLIISGDE